MQQRSALLVAESGGHLDQLTRLEARLSPTFDRVLYATSPTDQSQALLADRHVHYVPRVPPRGLLSAHRALGPAFRLLRREKITAVVSTGSAIAVPYLLAARVLGLEAHYVESAARTTGPSVTGRILRRIPGVSLYTQYSRWSNDEWKHEGSVFDGFDTEEVAGEPRPPRRVVVTLGTMKQYPFERAVTAARRVLEQVADADTEILWQVGTAGADQLQGAGHVSLPADQLISAIVAADLVIAHAGTGSSLQILDAGKVPVLLPRSSEQGEHVDDHQQLIADELSSRGLAVTCDPEDLDVQMIRTAMSRRAVRLNHPEDFKLRPHGG